VAGESGADSRPAVFQPKERVSPLYCPVFLKQKAAGKNRV
jgi:hypothetical protein